MGRGRGICPYLSFEFNLRVFLEDHIILTNLITFLDIFKFVKVISHLGTKRVATI